jgi:hypothetical protein
MKSTPDEHLLSRNKTAITVTSQNVLIFLHLNWSVLFTFCFCSSYIGSLCLTQLFSKKFLSCMHISYAVLVTYNFIKERQYLFVLGLTKSSIKQLWSSFGTRVQFYKIFYDILGCWTNFQTCCSAWENASTEKIFDHNYRAQNP